MLGQLVKEGIDLIVVGVILLTNLAVEGSQRQLSPVGCVLYRCPACCRSPKGWLEGNLELGDDLADGVVEGSTHNIAKRVESRDIHGTLHFCLDIQIHFLPMGTCFSKDRPFIQVGKKVITRSQFLKLKTFRDVLCFSGIIVSDHTALGLIMKDGIHPAMASDPFMIVSAIEVGNQIVYVKKLYGK